MTDLAHPPLAAVPSSPSLASDEDLARRASAGDEDAFGVLAGRYQARLEAYCRTIVRHDEDARDAVQNTFAKPRSTD